MPVYQMRAPNGRTYRISGPAGATDEQVRAAILSQYPDAGEAPKPKEDVSQWAGVLSGAVAPYLTAGALGAAAGAPLGGVGAIPGAAGGVLSLGLADLGTGIYNAAAPMWGGQRVQSPSDVIRNQFVNAGLAANPETPGQRVAADVTSGLAGAIAEPAAMSVQAVQTASPTMRRILNALAEQRRAQAGAGVGASAAPSVAQNYMEVTDPLALMGLSLAAGMVGGKRAAARPEKVTPEQARARASATYDAARRANVNVSAGGMTGLQTRIDRLLQRRNYDPDFHPVVREAADLFAAKAGAPMTFENLEEFRRTVRDLPYSQGGGKRGTSTERALIGEMADTINDYMMKLHSAQTTAGNADAAKAHLSEARNIARGNFEADLIAQAADKARRRATGSMASNLQSEFNKIAGNPNRMGRLTPETQTFINSMAEGRGVLGPLTTVGKAAPQFNWPTVLTGLGGSAAGMSQGFTPWVVGGATLGGGAVASKMMANRMAGRRVDEMANQLRGGTPFQMPTAQIAAQTTQQLAQQFGFPPVDEYGGSLIGVGQNASGSYFPQYADPEFTFRVTDTSPRRDIAAKRK